MNAATRASRTFPPKSLCRRPCHFGRSPPESARKIGHPAPFPVALAERVIKLYSFVGDVVLDPFAGSGSTCVAAVRHARHYVGFDMSPAYCEIARRRIAQAEAEATAPPNAARPRWR